MYGECQKRMERAVDHSTDFTNWALVSSHKSQVRVYQNERNASNQQCAMRLVIQVPGTVHSSVDMLRLLDSPSFRLIMKEMHGKTFIDGEVLHADGPRHNDSESSLALKWIALNTGTMFTKPKEFLYYEYCGVHHSRKYGPVGVVFLESYDGVGAKYGIRARPDSFKLATFDPSYFIMTPSAEPGKTVITLTVSSKKAGGSNLVSPSLKTLMLKYTANFANLEGLARTSMSLPSSRTQSNTMPDVAPPPSRTPDHIIPAHRASEPPPPRPASLTSDTSASSAPPHTSKKKPPSKRQEFINSDFEEICHSAMQVLNCPMAGIRTNLFELVHYDPHVNPANMPKSLPTFRRMAQSGKPCVVLDVNSDKRISVDRRATSRIQFFVGVPLTLESGECIGDICVADVKPRKIIDFNALEILKVLAQSATQYMSAAEYLAEFTDLPRDMELNGQLNRRKEPVVLPRAPPPMAETSYARHQSYDDYIQEDDVVEELAELLGSEADHAAIWSREAVEGGAQTADLQRRVLDNERTKPLLSKWNV
ncbi:hypothetical protein DYB35_002953 [Aphanomyces astaci]|uniref:GAF domain-containing protein n=1 Tax=Aphanomyces astaci TaxID=112090 RepID=A0A418D8Y3_APHAT|nr:hypothetical protein DYB35_002953 [Aphanomyces astaci]